MYNGINRFDYCGGATMDIHEIYQEDNKFEGEESIYYVLVGKVTRPDGTRVTSIILLHVLLLQSMI